MSILCRLSFLTAGMEDIQEQALGLQHPVQSPGSSTRFETNVQERVEELVNELDEALRTNYTAQE